MKSLLVWNCCLDKRSILKTVLWETGNGFTINKTILTPIDKMKIMVRLINNRLQLDTYTAHTHWLIKLCYCRKCNALYLHQKYLLQILLCVCVCARVHY